MQVEEVADYFGGKASLARAISMTVGGIARWGDTVPPSRRAQIREAMRLLADQRMREARALRAAAKV